MTKETQNQLTASLFRQFFYAKMLEHEHAYFLKFPLPSGIKNVLYKMKQAYHTGILQMGIYLPNSRQFLNQSIEENQEKIQAISNIVTKLALLDEDSVLRVEDDFNKLIQINWGEVLEDKE